MVSSRVASPGPAAHVLKRVLDVAWFVLLIGSVVAATALVVAMAVGDHLHVTFPVAFSVRGTFVVAGSSHPASVTQGSGRLSIQLSAGLTAAVLALVVAVVGFALVVLHQLRALMSEALAGSPFGTRSARRVRVIGVAIIGVEVFRALVVFAGSLWAQSHVHGPGLSFRAAFPVNLEVVGLGILVVLLAEVFRHGAALQVDHDLTV